MGYSVVHQVRRSLGARASRFRPGIELMTFGAPAEGRYEPPEWG